MEQMPVILSAVGTGLGVYGDVRGGREDSNALATQAKVAREQAARDEEATRRASRHKIGEMAASFAQAGGGVDEGVLRRSTINAELDALNVRYAGVMRAQGLLALSKAVSRASKLGAASKILAGVSDIYKLRNPTI